MLSHQYGVAALNDQLCVRLSLVTSVYQNENLLSKNIMAPFQPRLVASSCSMCLFGHHVDWGRPGRHCQACGVSHKIGKIRHTAWLCFELGWLYYNHDNSKSDELLRTGKKFKCQMLAKTLTCIKPQQNPTKYPSLQDYWALCRWYLHNLHW